MEIDKNCSCMGKSLERFLQPTILLLLNEGDAHGFALIQRISETPLFCNTYPDASGLYRYLKKMEQQGLLESYEEMQQDFPSKRVYRITEHGRLCLKNWNETIADYTQRLVELEGLIRESIGAL